ncbi:S-adenosylmethionine-dependent tRNA (m5U54) methyltransferase [Aureococcus anophagefferens]|nr:S-adenosylmethionine-dependent tRNA (m5U54) methyltransferase [Aureococcus anophagefferens]
MLRRALSTVSLEITALSNRGAGIALHDGLVVFVDGAAPGDQITAKIVAQKKKKRAAEATLLAVERPSPDRREPACEYFGRCGGCQYQHLSLDAQRRWKRQHVVDAWRRVAFPGGPARRRRRSSAATPPRSVAEVVGTDAETGYRDKLTPRSANGATGFAATRGGALVDVHTCLLARAEIADAYAATRASGERCPPLLRLSEDGRVATAPETLVERRIAGLTFSFKASDFFQINAGVADLLVRHVVDRCAGFRVAVDAYCGVGLFAVAIAKAHDCAVHGFDVASPASKFRFPKGAGVDAVVVVDPPRAGLDARFLGRLLAFAPKRIVYVSCEPATQARDAPRLLAGPYACRDVQPFDMFPSTRHVETVAVFDRVEAPG